MIPENRLKHSYSVGKKMEELAISRGWSQEVQQDLYTLGLNHDIGYEKRIPILERSILSCRTSR